MNKFYVYGHYDSNNCLKYIGKGKGNRAYAFYQRGSLWKTCFNNSDKKPIVKILKDNLTEDESFEYEIHFISEALKEGIKLLNICHGGYGGDTRNWTEQSRKILSEMRKGEKCYWFGRKRDNHVKKCLDRTGKTGYWKGRKRDSETMRKFQEAGHSKESIEKRRKKMLGKKWTLEHRRKISEGNKGKRIGWNPSTETRLKMSLSHLGKPGRQQSEETKEKLRQAQLGRSPSEETRKKIGDAHRGKTTAKAKKVLCIETNEVFRCAAEASSVKHANIKHIQACCVGRRKRTGGFTWRYFE